jgi:hypothetical protein
MLKKLPDSFLLGMVSGLASLSLFYFALSGIRSLLVDHYGNPYMLAAPKVQLFSIFLNVLCFRFIVVKTDKDKFGRGLLLVTILFSFVYFYYFLRYHHSIIGS